VAGSTIPSRETTLQPLRFPCNRELAAMPIRTGCRKNSRIHKSSGRAKPGVSAQFDAALGNSFWSRGTMRNSRG